MLSNAATVFALNLYAFALTNPVAVMLACGSIYPSLDFYFDGELGIWERYWRQIVLGIGIAATIIAVVLAPFTCGGSVGAGAAIVTALFNIAKATIIGAITTLAIGSYVSGIKSIIAGNSFWDGFSDYFASVNLVDVFLTSFAFAAVTAAASSIVRFRQCFKEGTLVATEDGLKPIEEIEVGDKVLAYDEETGEQAYKEVVRLFRNETEEWYHITANGEELVCTGGHPFFVKDKGFVSAKDLSVGDILRLSDGALIPVSAISVEKLEQPETTYNFEVAEFHTYYVGESEVLVHNTCAKDALSKAKVDEFTVKNKHLNSSGGKWSKFNVGTEAEAKAILKETVNRSNILSAGNNSGVLGSLGQKSFDIVLDAGKVIGTRGESSILMIIDEFGNIWTVFPK